MNVQFCYSELITLWQLYQFCLCIKVAFRLYNLSEVKISWFEIHEPYFSVQIVQVFTSCDNLVMSLIEFDVAE